MTHIEAGDFMIFHREEKNKHIKQNRIHIKTIMAIIEIIININQLEELEIIGRDMTLIIIEKGRVMIQTMNILDIHIQVIKKRNFLIFNDIYRK